MSYLAKERQSNHPVPVEPVLAVVEMWLEENAKRTGWTARGKRDGLLRPERQLAQAMGLKWSTVARQLYRMRFEAKSMAIVTADRYVDATYGHRLWNVDKDRADELASYGLPCLADAPRGDNSWMLPEERVEGEWGIRHWAWVQVKAMSPKERRAVTVGLDRLETEDDSAFARHARRLAA